MSNRAQRRQAAKEQPRWKRTMTREQRMAALVKNGIRPEDVDAARREGYEAGGRDARELDNELMCAALALTLNELHGFGQKRIVRVINRMAEIMMETFTSREIVDQVYDRLGLTLVNDPATGRMVEEKAD